MKNIYFKPYPNRQEETKFFYFLLHSIIEINHIKKSFELPNKLLDNLIITSEVINSIEYSDFISDKKKLLALEYLSRLPEKFKVARNIKNLSVDFVIEDSNELTFIEFHEKQHHRLSDYRLKPVFTEDDVIFEVPRFVQRLIKDIWRWKNLNNYKIIWYDWFNKIDKPSIIFANNKNEEFALPNKFKISTL